MAEIEHIDDEADGAGINFVKIDDKLMAKEFGVFALPAIVFFKMNSKEPIIYAGDLYDEDQILNWLMTQKNPGGDVIENLEGQRLVSLIEESGSLAVYFCKYLVKHNRISQIHRFDWKSIQFSYYILFTYLYKFNETYLNLIFRT